MTTEEEFARRRLAHLVEVRRALHRHQGRCVASHESAAIAQHTPVFEIPRKAQLTRIDGFRRNGRVRAVAAPLARDDICVVDGIPVTSLARTAVDIARMRPFLHGLVTADAVLRRRIPRAQLFRVLDAMPRWPGVKTARQVVICADGRPEAASESILRGRFILLGVDMPEPQYWIRTAAGWVRVDFYWDQHLLIGEVDGMVKYVAKSDLVEEKLRQERLEEERAVIRWTWAQAVLSTDEQLLARLHTAFVRGDRLRTLLNTSAASTECARRDAST